MMFIDFIPHLSMAAEEMLKPERVFLWQWERLRKESECLC